MNDDKSEYMKPCVSCLTSFIRTVVSLVSIFYYYRIKIKIIFYTKLYFHILDGTKYQKLYS